MTGRNVDSDYSVQVHQSYEVSKRAALEAYIRPLRTALKAYYFFSEGGQFLRFQGEAREER